MLTPENAPEMDRVETNAEAGVPQSGLSESDGAALQALAEAGFRIDQVPAELRERAAKVGALLDLLNTPTVDATSAGRSSFARSSVGQSLIARTLDRVRSHAAQVSAGNPSDIAAAETLALSPDDEDALELLVAARMDPARVPSGVRARARHQAALLSLMDLADTEIAIDAGERARTRARLVGSTLAHVQQNIDRASERTKLVRTIQPERGSSRFKIGDLIAAAAVLLISGSVLLPLANATREFSRRAGCQANMLSAGLAFGQYANDYRESLPVASPSQVQTPWWFVGEQGRSNSANLFTITRAGYTGLQSLACAGNPEAGVDRSATTGFDWRSIGNVSYSYQNMFANERPRWTQRETMVVLSDRSPIISLAMRGEKINPISNSLQHGGRGQYFLRTDGSSFWMTTPVLANGDNAFLPRPLEQLIERLQSPNEADPLKGTESPEGADDVFLVP